MKKVSGNFVKDNKKNNILPWAMWGGVCFYYIYQYFVRVAPTVINEELVRYFSLTASSFGTLCGYYYFTYTFLQVPVGLVLDKYGPRLVSAVACIICGIGEWIFIAVPDYNIAAMGRALTGIGSAAAFSATMKIGVNWFDKSRMVLINNLTIAMGTLGACMGAPVFAYLKQSYDWRQLLVGAAIFGVALGVFVYLFVRDQPEKANTAQTKKSSEEKISLFDGLRFTLKSRQCWIVSIYIMLIYAVLSGFADMWGVPFLKLVYNLDTVSASFASNVIYIGMVIGGPLFAWFSIAVKGRKICLWTGTVLSATAFGIVVFWPGLNYFILSACLFLVGFGLSGGFVVYTLLLENSPVLFSGTIVAFVNMFSMISGVILQPSLGWLLKKMWDGTFCNDVPFYGVHSYKVTIGVIVLCLFLSLLFIPFLKESFPKEKRNNN